ncbi:DNA repair protein swi5 homolog [Plakobranchus ocellatus]|uniref:DNA repair protein SWI5 homolog n=1 Tax=Plakobranchus ocellatus TaxID=259542 RepID=A0AAV3Y2K6_9GAST|nr:DNA repair protein swi5 homolog [Plakobranchus ocellatus]
MNDKASLQAKLGAAGSDFGTPLRKINKSCQGKSRLKSPLASRFKSPLTRDKSSNSQNLTESQFREQLLSSQRKISEVDKEIEELRASGYKESELQIHIDKLHEYNEIKDVGQMILGRIAVIEGVQTKDLYPRYGLDLAD